MSASIESRRKYIAFLLVCLFAACASIVCALFRGGVSNSLSRDLFADFFNHIKYIRNDGAAQLYYQGYDASFPPFIYIMYSLFDALLPKDISLLERSVPMLLYVWYCTICGALFTLLASAYSKKKSSSIIVN